MASGAGFLSEEAMASGCEWSAGSGGEDGAAVCEGARISSQHRNSQPHGGARGAGAGEAEELQLPGRGMALPGVHLLRQGRSFSATLQLMVVSTRWARFLSEEEKVASAAARIGVLAECPCLCCCMRWFFNAEGTSLGVEKIMAEAAMEMESNIEVKSRKKKKRKKGEWRDASDRDIEWMKSLLDCHLVLQDLMLSIKHLAMVRVKSTREKALNGFLTPVGLLAIGIILEEFMMNHVHTLRNAPESPSVIDELLAIMGKAEDDSNEANQVEMAVEVNEQS